MEFKSSFRVSATLIPNEFIDSYMANASGEYIKEYLYLLRHEGEAVTLSMIADALNHTESDVARAISYWKKAGALMEETVKTENPPEAYPAGDNISAGGASASGGRAAASYPAGAAAALIGGMEARAGAESAVGAGITAGTGAVSISGINAAAGTASLSGITSAATAGNPSSVNPQTVSVPPAAADGAFPQGQAIAEPAGKTPRAVYTMEQISGLAGDEDFSQLLYIAQKYLNKVFTQRECEVFAYLYDGLHMTAELLEYVVEYCVQGGHTSIRYIETVAVNWHEKGLKTVDEAKSYASSFSKDSFAVMKAFGLNDRNPAAAEREMIDRWFRSYGFTRELVLEACNRTIEATHSPSFKYAEKILSEWKKACVRTLEDVKKLDEKRTNRTSVKSQNSQERRTSSSGRTSQNQFQNFPQRDIDYDALVLQQLKEQ